VTLFFPPTPIIQQTIETSSPRQQGDIYSSSIVRVISVYW